MASRAEGDAATFPAEGAIDCDIHPVATFTGDARDEIAMDRHASGAEMKQHDA
jgi:hypothetical protein